MVFHHEAMIHLDNAHALLEKSDEANLLYAALELRLSIECLVYEALPHYLKTGQLPDEVNDHWKPKQILDILVDCNPTLPNPSQILGASQNEPSNWIKLGSQNGLNPALLNSLWQRLSSFLHKRPESRANDIKKLRKSIELAISQLEVFRNDDIQFNLNATMSFICTCGRKVVRQIIALHEDPLVTCPNKECHAVYEWNQSEQDSQFSMIQYEFTCPSCNSKTYFGKHLFGEGKIIECTEPSCAKKWQLQTRYGLVPFE